MILPDLFATDKVEVVTGILTVIGLIVAIIALFQTVSSIRQASTIATHDRKEALSQAIKDLRWRQTVEAQGAIRRMLDDAQAFEAMAMSDFEDRSFVVNGKSIHITFIEVQRALAPELESFSDLQIFIRDRFDTLLAHLELMQQGVDAKIFILQDLIFPIDYYIERIEKNIGLSTVKDYIRKFGFPKSERFIDSIVSLKVGNQGSAVEGHTVESSHDTAAPQSSIAW
jgi:hypothetical protein